MDLTYSDEQRAFADSIERFLKSRGTAAGRPSGADDWREMAGLGWLGLPFDADNGGLGGSFVEVGLLAEAFGRHQVNTPLVSSIVLAGGLIEGLADPDQRQRWLPALIAGEARIAAAHEEGRRGPDTGSLATTLDAAGRLNGGKANVLDGADAEAFIVSARRPDGRVVACHVPNSAPGLRIEPFPTVDGRTAARLAFTETPAEVLGDGYDGSATVALVVDRAVAVLAADLTGAMAAALDATVAYVKVREQFGQPLGANQVIKHRLVEMAVKCEEARSISLGALIRVGDGSDASLRRRAVSAAKAKVARDGRWVTEQAIQLHGGMGVTEELPVGGYLKRVLAFEAVLGTSRWHKARYGANNAEVAS
jgi:hypothetical protein